MEQLILNVKNKSKLNLLIELVKHLDFVEVAEAPQLSNKEKKILKNLETAVEDVNLHKKGKKKLKKL